MNCRKCGAINPDSASFCGKCGAALKMEASDRDIFENPSGGDDEFQKTESEHHQPSETDQSSLAEFRMPEVQEEDGRTSEKKSFIHLKKAGSQRIESTEDREINDALFSFYNGLIPPPEPI